MMACDVSPVAMFCDSNITKLFLLTFSIQNLTATGSFANLQRIEIYRQYVGPGCTRSVSIGRCILKRFPALVGRTQCQIL